MDKQRNFIAGNNSFLCAKCGEEVSAAAKTTRNHCPYCLWSLHVDAEVPGDRLSPCGGLMRPISAKQNNKQEWQIIHRCESCGKRQANKLAPDDDWEVFIKISGSFD